MADTVVKTVEDVDKLFSQIVVNGETYNSDRYVPPAPVQVIEEPEPEPQQTEISQNPSVPSGQTIQGEDVYAVVLNDEQHNFVDPEEVSSRTEADTTLQGNINSINALIPSDTSTSNKLVNESGIQDAVDTAVENAVADLDVPSVGGNGKYIKAISETNGKISATEGTIADTVESGNNNPVTSDAVNSAIAGMSGDVTQQIADAIGELDVASAGGSGKYISAISETDGKISATEGIIDSSVTGGSGNPVTGGAVNTAITNAIGALDVASAGGSGKYISAISETDGKISATEGMIDSAVTSGSNNPVTSDAVSTAISSISEDVTQQISDAIGALDVASAGGSGKFIQSISETDGKISATEGTIDNAVNQNSSNPVTGGAVKTAIDNAISSVYKPAGDKTVAQLTSALLVAGNLGNVYNITDSGTTTSDFVEGAGKPISAGDNVAIVDTGSQGSPSYKFDLLSGFIDLSNYIQKSQTSGLVKNDGTVDTTVYASQSSLSSYIQKSQTQGLVKNDGTIDTTAYAKQSEMSVTPGTGTDSDKTTIQLKTGTSATVLTQHIPAGSSTPVMDGTGSAGSSTSYAREDHVHPSDTSKQDVLTFDSVPTENSTNPVTSGGIYTALQEKSSATDLPTDAVLHYSFDEVPDYPDGTAVYFRNKDFLSTDGWGGGSNIVTINNGILTVGNVTDNYIFKAITSGNIIKSVVKSSVDATIVLYATIGGNAVSLLSKSVKANIPTEYIASIPSGNLTSVGFHSQVIGSKFEMFTFYIGNGSYSTPVIDNSNGQWNSTRQSGIAVQGVSGKGLKCFEGNDVSFESFNLTDNFSVSIWVNPENNTSQLNGIILRKDSQFQLRNGGSWQGGNYLQIYLYSPTQTIYESKAISSLLPPNIWSHIVIVKNGTNVKAYLNGSRIQNLTIPESELRKNNNPFYVSTTSNKRNQSYDDLLIFDRALSEQEVKALYLNKANTPKYYPPLTMVDSELSTESSNPVENKVVTSRLNEMTEIASSLPTDAVLHYSFDDVPDYPDGTADVRLLDNNTYDIQSTNYQFKVNNNATISNSNGNVQISITGAGSSGVYITNSYITGKIIKLKLNVTAVVGTINVDNENGIHVLSITQAGIYEVAFLHTSNTQYPNLYIFCRGEGNSCTFTVEQIYIGDGSYSTPVIDNANGENNATNNGGIAVQGVSGKGLITVSQDSKIVLSNGVLPLKRTFSIWCWFPNTDWGSRTKRLWRFNLADYVNLDIINNLHRITAISRNTASDTITAYFNIEQLLEQWIHIVIVDDFSTNGGSKTIYINGKNVAQTVATGDFTGVTDANPWTLLSYSHMAQNGAIEGLKADDFLFFDRALSETEVLALYQNKANTPKYFPTPTKEIKQDSWELATSGGVFNALENKTSKVSGATAGNLAGLDASGNLTDSGVKGNAVPALNGADLFTTGGAYDFFAKSVTSSSWLGKVLGRFMGRKWTLATMGLYTPAYGGGVWVAGSESSGLWYKEGNNGTWTQVTVNISSTRKAYTPVYANGLWVTLANNTSGMYNVWWSTDGKNWTAGSIPSYSIQMNIAYVNGLWVAGTNNSIIWSEDGKTWSNSNTARTGFGFYKPTYAHGLWHIGTDDTRLYWSSDGKNWTLCTGSFTSLYHIYSPVFNPILNQWFAGSSSGLYKSNDGKAWDKITGDTASVNMFTPVVVGSLLIAGSTNGLWYSYTGSGWTQCLSSGETKTPLYANGTFITDDGSNIYVSDNGIDWHIAEYDGSPSNLSYPFYANGMWMIGTESTDELIYSDIEMVMENLTD